jgi:hypothetical protein
MPTTRSPRPRKLTVFRPAYDDAAWRTAHATGTYVMPGTEYEDYAPAYRYGVLVADKHGQKTFAEVEPLLAEEWAAVRGSSRLEWDKARPAVRDGYAGVAQVPPLRAVRSKREPGAAGIGTRKRTRTKRAATSGPRGDDRTKRGPRDRSRVNVNEPWELKYWSNRFGVTPTELRRAVKSAGPMVKDVRRQLGK